MPYSRIAPVIERALTARLLAPIAVLEARQCTLLSLAALKHIDQGKLDVPPGCDHGHTARNRNARPQHTTSLLEFN